MNTAEIAYPVKGELWRHQRAGLARSDGRAAFAFHHDPGLGKSLTEIAEAGDFFAAGLIDTVVVVAPFRVHRQWIEKQFPRWADYRWHGWIYPGNTKMKTQRARQRLDEALEIKEVLPALRVFAFNFEALRLPSQRGNQPLPLPHRVLDEIYETSRAGVMFVVDEMHRAKDPKSQTTRGILRYGKGKSKVRRALTGTPILQGHEDLWSQYEFLDPMIFGNLRFTQFRDIYCKTAPVPGRTAVKIVGSQNSELLRSRIAAHTSRVLDTDALDMPPQVFHPDLIVEMSPAQQRAYDQMETRMMARLPSGEDVVTDTVLVQLLRLHQLAQGFMQVDGGEVEWLSDAKIAATAQQVDDLGGRHVVVWAPFIPLLERLTIDLDAVRYDGPESMERWAKRGGPLIANPRSGGTGVDGMQVANHSIYVANSHHLEARLQSLKRIHRGEQDRSCFYTDLVTEGSVDKVVLRSLRQKKSISDMTFNELREALGRNENDD